jgi:hypothetical protein
VTRRHLARAQCARVRCAKVMVFSVQVAEGVVTGLSSRVMAAAGWLCVDKYWHCDRCARALRELVRMGDVSLERAIAVESAVIEAEQYQRIEVGP